MKVEVLTVAPLFAPHSDGTWPCGICGHPFDVADSWRVCFKTTAAVVCCRRCADDAERTRRAQPVPDRGA